MTSSNLPDICIIDLNLPSKNNDDPVTMLHKWNSNLPIIVLSDSLSPSIAIKILRNGASGYIVRKDDSNCLVQGIKKVNRGERYVSNLINDNIVDSVVSGQNFGEIMDERISSREKEILQLIAQGNGYQEIGDLLVISKRTVETHRNNIMRKLGLSSQIDIIKYAVKNGLITLD